MKRQSSIKNRIQGVILVTSVIVLLATAAAFVFYEVISFKAQLVRNISTLAAVIADNSAAPLAFENKSNAEEILAALKAEPDIVTAAVYDAEGKVFATYPTPLPSYLLPPRLEGRGHQFRSGDLILFQPIMQEHKPIGSLYLGVSLRGLSKRYWRYGAIAAWVLIGSLMVAYALAVLLERRISKPILALTNASKAVSEQKDYSTRAPRLTNDELGTLTDAFNLMLAQTEEGQVRLSEQARLLDLSNDAIIVRDLYGRIAYWNRGAEEAYGWKRAEAVGKMKNELLKTEFPAPLAEIEALLYKNNRWSGDLIQTRRDGTLIHVSTRWALDRDAQGQPVRILITDNDITVRKQAEALMESEAKRLEALVQQRTAKLQETIGELEAFSYSISHDMRAPLRAMQGYAKALLEDYKDRLDSEASEYLQRITRASHRLDSLIQDVLAYSKVAKGEIELHPVDMERLIEDIIPNYPEFQLPRARVIVEKPLHSVLGHEAYLTQCVTNLLGNAVKFVPAGVLPEVRIRSERVDGRVRFWFEDNGIGIEPSHYQRIFQIFGQVYPEKKYGGTGIGLAIVRKAVQRMNGEVGVESELGKGSRFWILLNGSEQA